MHNRTHWSNLQLFPVKVKIEFVRRFDRQDSSCFDHTYASWDSGWKLRWNASGEIVHQHSIYHAISLAVLSHNFYPALFPNVCHSYKMPPPTRKPENTYLCWRAVKSQKSNYSSYRVCLRFVFCFFLVPGNCWTEPKRLPLCLASHRIAVDVVRGSTAVCVTCAMESRERSGSLGPSSARLPNWGNIIKPLLFRPNADAFCRVSPPDQGEFFPLLPVFSPVSSPSALFHHPLGHFRAVVVVLRSLISQGDIN